MSNFLSLVILVFGPVLLGAVIAYGMIAVREYSATHHHGHDGRLGTFRRLRDGWLARL